MCCCTECRLNINYTVSNRWKNMDHVQVSWDVKCLSIFVWLRCFCFNCGFNFHVKSAFFCWTICQTPLFHVFDITNKNNCQRYFHCQYSACSVTLALFRDLHSNYQYQHLHRQYSPNTSNEILQRKDMWMSNGLRDLAGTSIAKQLILSVDSIWLLLALASCATSNLKVGWHCHNLYDLGECRRISNNPLTYFHDRCVLIRAIYETNIPRPILRGQCENNGFTGTLKPSRLLPVFHEVCFLLILFIFLLLYI